MYMNTHDAVFTYIYSLLIEKDVCDRQNVSIKLLCVPFVWRSFHFFGKSFVFLFLFLCCSSCDKQPTVLPTSPIYRTMWHQGSYKTCSQARNKSCSSITGRPTDHLNCSFKSILAKQYLQKLDDITFSCHMRAPRSRLDGHRHPRQPTSRPLKSLLPSPHLPHTTLIKHHQKEKLHMIKETFRSYRSLYNQKNTQTCCGKDAYSSGW